MTLPAETREAHLLNDAVTALIVEIRNEANLQARQFECVQVGKLRRPSINILMR